jgi:hypothetical protein
MIAELGSEGLAVTVYGLGDVLYMLHTVYERLILEVVRAKTACVSTGVCGVLLPSEPFSFSFSSLPTWLVSIAVGMIDSTSGLLNFHRAMYHTPNIKIDHMAISKTTAAGYP